MKNVSWFLNAFQINDSKEMSFSNFFQLKEKRTDDFEKQIFFWSFKDIGILLKKSHKGPGLILSFKDYGYFKLLIAELSKIRNSKS